MKALGLGPVDQAKSLIWGGSLAPQQVHKCTLGKIKITSELFTSSDELFVAGSIRVDVLSLWRSKL